jgi:hypothetical protein
LEISQKHIIVSQSIVYVERATLSVAFNIELPAKTVEDLDGAPEIAREPQLYFHEILNPAPFLCVVRDERNCLLAIGNGFLCAPKSGASLCALEIEFPECIALHGFPRHGIGRRLVLSALLRVGFLFV